MCHIKMCGPKSSSLASEVTAVLAAQQFRVLHLWCSSTSPTSPSVCDASKSDRSSKRDGTITPDEGDGSQENRPITVTEFVCKVAPVGGRITDSEFTALRQSLVDALDSDSFSVGEDRLGQSTVIRITGERSLSSHWTVARSVASGFGSCRVRRAHFLVSGNQFVDILFVTERCKRLVTKSMSSIEAAIRQSFDPSMKIRVSSSLDIACPSLPSSDGTDENNNVLAAAAAAAAASFDNPAMDRTRSRRGSFGLRPAFLRRSESRRQTLIAEAEADNKKETPSGETTTSESNSDAATTSSNWFREPQPRVEPEPKPAPESVGEWLWNLMADTGISVQWEDKDCTDDTWVSVSCPHNPYVVTDVLSFLADIGLLVQSATCTSVQAKSTTSSSGGNPPSPKQQQQDTTTTSSTSSTSSTDSTSSSSPLADCILNMSIRVTDSLGRPVRCLALREWARELIACVTYTPRLPVDRCTAVEYVAESHASGFLEAITSAMMLQKVQVQWGRIGFLDERFQGAFHIQDCYGMPFDSEIRLHMINESVVASIAAL
eukprot:CAMPEP_0184649976 /NCGR_PEP_ID=MMETSP0308-20130426/7446_1 /TAXON_ID=38269 /ORGANISM="Gloeochaete witrockiana, Strain SAG 46.84" /LENGTH=545 /DNA_ID=CAMNT_0027083149 /DNA_START=245 /DNA_END=1883 /DNA_ORIENTATION=+